eukprot:3414852-Rhodomonas_salina.2
MSGATLYLLLSSSSRCLSLSAALPDTVRGCEERGASDLCSKSGPRGDRAQKTRGWEWTRVVMAALLATRRSALMAIDTWQVRELLASAGTCREGRESVVRQDQAGKRKASQLIYWEITRNTLRERVGTT